MPDHRSDPGVDRAFNHVCRGANAQGSELRLQVSEQVATFQNRAHRVVGLDQSFVGWPRLSGAVDTFRPRASLVFGVGAFIEQVLIF